MYPGRYYMPTMGINQMMNPSYIVPRNIGLFGRLTRGIKSVKWGNVLNEANKTLNVVNQTIPLVKQAGPMFNNMKSMFKIARAFGNETTKKNYNNQRNNIRRYQESSNVQKKEQERNEKKEVLNNEYPNFFI